MRVLLSCFFICVISMCNAQLHYQKLLDGYIKKSQSLTNEYLEDWHNEILPISDLEFGALNDTIKNVYEIAEAYLKPSQSDSDSTSFNYNYHLGHIKYVPIQNSIDYAFINEIFFSEDELNTFLEKKVSFLVHNNPDLAPHLEKTNGRYPESVIMKFASSFYRNEPTNYIYSANYYHFQPRIKVPGKSIIYMNGLYRQDIFRFTTLYEVNVSKHRGNRYKRKISMEHFRRENFLTNMTNCYFDIIKPDLNKEPLFDTFIYYIVFNRDMNRARVVTNLNTYVYYQKDNDRWKYVKTDMIHYD